MEDEAGIESVLRQQHQELMEAKILESDLDYAFNLQMQEAIKASLSNQSIPSTSLSPPLPPPPQQEDKDDVFDYTTLLLQDLERFAQEHHDHIECEMQGQRMKRDLDRRIHDQKLAREIMNVPEDAWARDGDNYQRPYNDCDANETESCRIYFKGVVSEEKIRDLNVVVAAIGVAICDFRDNVLFEMKRGLEDGVRVSSERAELEALVTGLETATALSLERVTYFCDDYLLYQYVSFATLSING